MNFTEKDFNKPISIELAAYLKSAKQDDYIDAGIASKKSFETVKALATRRRNLLDKNRSCITELIKILKSKEAGANKEIKKFLQSETVS